MTSLTNCRHALTSGPGEKVGQLFGVATGVFELTKISSQAWTVGALVYWDDTNKRCTTVTTANLLIGVAAAAVAGGAGNPPAAPGSMPRSGRMIRDGRSLLRPSMRSSPIPISARTRCGRRAALALASPSASSASRPTECRNSVKTARVAGRRYQYPALAGGNDHRGRFDPDRRRDVQDHRRTVGRCARARVGLRGRKGLGLSDKLKSAGAISTIAAHENSSCAATRDDD